MHKTYCFTSHLTRHLSLGTLAVLASANIAHADMLSATVNIVQNPGFETGNFTDWTTGGGTSPDAVDTTMPHTGTYAADFQNTDPGSLIQDLATTPGTSYDLSFYLASNSQMLTSVAHPSALADLTQPMEFQAYFGGVLVYDTATQGDPGEPYIEINMDNLAGTGATTTLEFDFSTQQFSFNPGPAAYYLDDVSVTAVVPEPSTWIMMLAGAGLCGAAMRLRRRPLPASTVHFNDPCVDVSSQANIAAFAV